MLICLACVLFNQLAHADDVELDDRLVAQLRAYASSTSRLPAAPAQASPAPPLLANVQVEGCSSYPYGAGRSGAAARGTLYRDLADGLATGLQCLSGRGPMGPLHPYHASEADRLIALFTSPRSKTLTFKCVEDAMFATAVATGPGAVPADDPLFAQLSKVRFPAVILDTHRLGGLLSRRFDDATYRNVYHLGDEQILEHKTGQPLRADSLHRYRNRGALLFHEIVHWLGHQHSAIYPDIAHLYETCCFGGSDYISDPASNRGYQQTACTILKDDRLWAAGNSRDQQMRLWRHSGYDRLKTRMRADYSD